MLKKIFYFVLFCFCPIYLYSGNNAHQLPLTEENHSANVKALVIEYDITYPNLRPTLAAITYNRCVTMISGSKVITTSFTESGDISTTLSLDGNENSVVFYSNMKLMMKLCRNDKITGVINQTVSPTDKTKSILGYICKENKMVVDIQVSNTNTNATSYYYIYDKLKEYNYDYILKGVKGVMLGCDADMTGGVIVRYTARSVTEQMVDSTMYTIPSDIEPLTMPEYIRKLSTDKEFSKMVNAGFKKDDPTATPEEVKIVEKVQVVEKVKKSKWKMIFDVLKEAIPLAAQTADIIINHQAPRANTSIRHENTNSTNSNQTSPKATPKTCSVCNGTGLSASYVTIAAFGSTEEHWCDYCKKFVPMTHGPHNNCPVCKGTKTVLTY